VRAFLNTLAIGVLSFTTACSGATPTRPASPPADTPTPTAAKVPVSRSPLANAPTSLAGLTPARVTNVVDGDTVDVAIGSQTYRVRYIGIDTPETVDPNRPVQPFGKEASARNKQLVDGKTVYLERDVSETDRFGRLLRYVWLDESTMVNAVLVSEGLAQVSTFPPDVKYVNLYLDLQRQAREKGAGIWGGGATPATVPPQPPAVTPTRATSVAVTTTPSRGNCDPSYPTVCIPPYPPDLDCGQIPFRRFQVLPPDPHRFDSDRDGIGC